MLEFLNSLHPFEVLCLCTAAVGLVILGSSYIIEKYTTTKKKKEEIAYVMKYKERNPF